MKLLSLLKRTGDHFWQLVSLLLKYGGNPYQVNSKGQSPLDVALNDDISRLLRKEALQPVFQAGGAGGEMLPVTGLLPKDQPPALLPEPHPLGGSGPDDSVTRAAAPTSVSGSSSSVTTDLTQPLSVSTSGETDSVAPVERVFSSPSSTGSSTRPASSQPSSTGFVQGMILLMNLWHLNTSRLW